VSIGKLNSIGRRKQPLTLALGAFFVSLVLWNVPELRFVIYPFRIFVTFVHEFSHGIAAELTGGDFVWFTVDPNTSGLTLAPGGVSIIVASAGYLGSALFGGLLLILGSQRGWARVITACLGLSFLVLTGRFAQNSFSAASGFFFAIAMIGVGVLGSEGVSAFFLNLLAIQCSLNALDSLTDLVAVSASGVPLRTDAMAMQEITGLPAAFWALLWSGIAIGVLYYCVRLVLK